MKETKLLKLFQVLSKDDLKQVNKILQSTYFTSNSNLLVLFKFLRPLHPEFNSKNLGKQKVFKKVFPKHEYSDIKIRKLFSEMSLLIEEYLISNELNENPLEKRKILLNVFMKKNANDLFEKEEKKQKMDLENILYRDDFFYKEKFELNNLQCEKIASKDLKARTELLHASLKNLEMYSKISEARIKNDINTISGFMNINLSPNIEVEKEGNVVLDIFSKLGQMYSTGNIEFIFQIKELLEQNLNVIRKSLQLDILLSLLNFSIKQMQKDDVTFNDIVFDLYKTGLENSILVQNGKITNNTFLNIVAASCKAKEIEWVTNFIKDYEKYLDKDSKEDLSKLAFSYLAFSQKDYKKVMDLLANHGFKLSLYDYGSKILLLKNYFELYLKDEKYYELLTSYFDSFEKWIRRNKLVDESKKKSTLNFISILRRLSNEKLKGKLDENKSSLYLDIVANQEITISRSWLLEKVMT